MRKLIATALVGGAVVVGLVAQAGSFLLAFPAPGAPAHHTVATTYGQHGVGVQSLASEGTAPPMTVWYPAVDQPETGAVTYANALSVVSGGSSIALGTWSGIAQAGADVDPVGGPHPVVILSHGFAVTTSSYAWLAEHLASHGFVVAGLHHDESLDPGRLWRSTIERPLDVRNAVARIGAPDGLDGVLGAVDTDRVAVVGHSYGGYTALAAAGARLDSHGLTTSCGSARRNGDPVTFLCDALIPRLDDMAHLAGLGATPPTSWPSMATDGIDAVVALAGDAVMFSSDGLDDVTVPVMVIGGTADTDTPFEWGPQLTWDSVSSGRKVEVALEGAGHMLFTTECQAQRRIVALVPLGSCSDPGWDVADAHTIVAEQVTSFLKAELVGDTSARLALSGQIRVPGISRRISGY